MIDSRQEDRSKETDRRGTSWMCVCDAAFYTGMTNLSHFLDVRRHPTARRQPIARPKNSLRRPII
jgi:hypothetical protein